MSQFTTQPNHCKSRLELILFIAQLDSYLNKKENARNEQFNIFNIFTCIIIKNYYKDIIQGARDADASWALFCDVATIRRD